VTATPSKTAKVTVRPGPGNGKVAPVPKALVRAVVAQALHELETQAQAQAQSQAPMKVPVYSTATAATAPRYDSTVHYDSGVRYAEDPVPTPVQTSTGAKVKLGLSRKNNAVVIDFARTHELAISGNANFPSPLPAPEVFGAKLTELEAVNAEYEEKRLALKAVNERRSRIRDEFNAIFTQRGTYVELQSGGSAELIQEVALPVQSPSVKLPQLASPIGLRTDLNGTPGVMRVRWETVTGARSYLLEKSVVLPDGLRDWVLIKVGGSNAKLEGLEVGTRYAFRVAAVGGAEGRSPWSLEVERVAG
jgi:hypothetical protein